MADEADSRKREREEGAGGGPQAGERLAEARRRQQISLGEVAKELHLDEPKVRALESNQFESLGAPVFAKGHLKKYAQLVGVNIDDVMADYYALNRTTGMPPVVGKIRKPRREIAPGPWFAGIAVLVAVMVAYWYFVVRDPGAPTPTDQPTPVAPSTTDEAPPPGAVPTPDTATSDSESATSNDDAATSNDDAANGVDGETVAVPQAVDAGAVAAAPAALNEVSLTLEFSGECWTEITDAGGRRLFFDLGRDGRRVGVSGQAPLSVLFGNADNVRVSVNGEAYPIDAASRRGKTARLTIYAP